MHEGFIQLKMACHSFVSEQGIKKMRGFLEIEHDELKFFTRRFFILSTKRMVLDYYKEDPLVNVFFILGLKSHKASFSTCYLFFPIPLSFSR